MPAAELPPGGDAPAPPPLGRSSRRFIRAVEVALSRIATRTYQRPWLTIGITVVACIAAAVASRRLRIDADLARLLPRSFSSVQDLRELERSVGAVGYVAVVGRGAPPRALRRFADDVTPKLERLPEVRYVDHRRPGRFFQRHALYYLDPARLAKLEQQLTRRLQWETLKRTPYHLDLDEGQPPPVDLPQDAATGERGLRQWLSGKSDSYYLDAERQLVAVLVKPMKLATDMAQARALVASVQQVVDSMDRSRYGPAFAVELTGRFAKLVAQQEQISRGLRVSFVAAALLIVAFLAFQLRRVVSVLLVLVPLAVALLATFGLAAVTFGALNILTAFIGAILLGLGIDHGIHLVHRYSCEHAAGSTPLEALQRSLSHTGRAVIIAALTTAIAMAGLGLSQFRAFREFGLLCAAGILFVVVAYVVLLPPLVRMITRAGWRPACVGLARPGGLWRPRWAPLLLWLLVVGLFATAVKARLVTFNADFGALEDPSLPATELDQEVNRLLGHSQTPVIVLTPDDASARHAARTLRQRSARRATASTIDFVVSSAELVPEQQAIKHLSLQRIDRLVRRIAQRVPAEKRARFVELRQLTAAQPFDKSDLPPEIKRLWPPAQQGFVLVFPAIRLSRGDRVIELAHEVRDIELPGGQRVSAAGEAMVMADMLSLLEEEATPVLLLTAVLVIAALRLLLGGFRPALCALLPAVVTIVATLGLMPLIGLELNYLNIVVLPVLFGVGVDGGAHLVTRLGGGEPLRHVIAETGPPVMGALLTTAIGFGALLLAGQPGLVSVGQVAVLGLSVNLISSLLLLPVLLAVAHQRHRRLHGTRRGSRLVEDASTVWSAGWIPRGGGTLGAWAALPLGWLLTQLDWPVRLTVVAVLVALSIAVVHVYCASCRKKDPSEVVLDEFIGYLVALQFVPWSIPWVLAAFVAFRLLDIFKPWPIRLFERLKGGTGVLADDLAAGAIAGCLLLALRQLG